MVRHTRRTFLKVSGSLLGGVAVGSTVTAAESAERFLVDTKRGSAGRLERSDLAVVHDLPEVDLAVVEGSESALADSKFDYAPDTTYELDLPVDDAPVEAEESATDEPLYPLQWDKHVQGVPDVHETTRGEGTRVAIVDTGVAAGHPDLAHAVDEDRSRDFTGDGYGSGGPYGGYHGTHVAGIVAASDENEAGVVGTAPGTEIVDCRVFSQTGSASFADMMAALVYSARIECDAVNMSIGAYPVSRAGLGSFYGKVLNRTTTYANRQGTLLVVSAGNDAADLQHDGPVVSLPNEAAQALSVSATGPIGFQWGEEGLEDGPRSPAYYTNYGTNAVDLAAPGGDVDLEAAAEDEVPWYYDLVLNTVAEPEFSDDGEYLGAIYDYNWVAGTSMAAPQVAGAVALVKSVAPDLNANQVESVLERTADVPDGYDKTYYGSGFLNPLAAVEDVE
ncbi:S8 family peptidase [Halobacterium yunchengense]|uniref:S8 family peptidase n=1 Tax=Halobacterium yunchengense TaxID=3108497 RepID=UPI00300AF7CD